MNERITELLVNSEIEYWMHSPSDLEKLVKLIVKECARISIEADDTMTNQGAASAQAFMLHFGITE